MDVWNNLTFRLGDKDYWDSCKVQFYVSNQLQSAFVWYDGNTYGEYLEPVEVTAAQNPDSVASTGSATAPTSPNRWHFSSKESQSFLSASIPFLDFGARMYAPITARWTAQDPLAEKYYAVSPYTYYFGTLNKK